VDQRFRRLVCWLALGLLAAVAGCGQEDRAKEYFEAEEQKAKDAEAGPATASREPDLDLKALIPPKKPIDNSIPPPKLVDVREVRDDFPDGSMRVVRSVKHFSDNSQVNHGPYTEWWPSGKKFKEGSYEDGKEDGNWVYYYDDGTKAKSGSYKNGKLDGVWTYWRPDSKDGKDGKPDRQEEYKLGARHGAWIRWHDNGKKAAESHLVDGVPDGDQFEWYKNGQLAGQARFKQGKPDGKAITWDEKGRKTGERTFRNGVLVDQVTSSGNEK
jgi:antitoxin component YwqK of YwqJK toxin-antitoxin module